MIGKTNIGGVGNGGLKIGEVTIENKSGDSDYLFCNGAPTSNANLLAVLKPSLDGGVYLPPPSSKNRYIKIR